MALQDILGKSTYQSLPPLVVGKLERLDEEDQNLFMATYKDNRKNWVVAYLCWIFTFHYLYLGGTKSLLTQIIFWITFGGFGIWWVFDFLRLPSVVNRINGELAIGIIRDIRQLS